jgi:hypothetical protein
MDCFDWVRLERLLKGAPVGLMRHVPHSNGKYFIGQESEKRSNEEGKSLLRLAEFREGKFSAN